MKLTMRIIIFSLIAIVLAGALIWGFLAGRTVNPPCRPHRVLL